MLTQVRLDILKENDFISRARRKAIESMFGGVFPAAIQVSLVKTKLDRSGFDRWRIRANRGSEYWTRYELELLGAFVSARNGCTF